MLLKFEQFLGRLRLVKKAAPENQARCHRPVKAHFGSRHTSRSPSRTQPTAPSHPLPAPISSRVSAAASYNLRSSQHHTNGDQQENFVASDGHPDHLLTEIFLRLPDSADLARASAA